MYSPSTIESFPSVNVPVLSKTIVSICFKASILSLDFIKTPLLLQFPIATTIASGVANPNAHGHATTKTLTKLKIALSISLYIARFNINERIAIRKITGTKYPLILSANLAIGALVFVASTTKFTICEMLESFPILSASYSIYPS